MTITFTPLQALLYAGLMCSSDVVAAVSIVSYEQQPKLFSCVFGEGVFNDIVSIILYNTVKGMLTQSFTAASPFIIIGEFVMLAVISLGLGMIFGFITSFAFKHLAFLRVNPITETFVMFSFSMVSYFVSEGIVIAGTQMSGITSLLTCGIVQSHYTYYNLSPQGKTCSMFVVSFMGTVAEAAIYSYVGIALLNAIPQWWSIGFIGGQFILIVIGRCIAVFLIFFLFRLCTSTRTINVYELVFITYAGMIRGAIAFALVLTLPYQLQDDASQCSEKSIPATDCFTYEVYQMLVNTTLVLVVLTTFIFGTFMGVVQKSLVAPSAQDEAEVTRDNRTKSVAEDNAKMRTVSVYEEMQHPNEEEDHDTEVDPGLLDKNGNKVGWTSSWFYNWFSDFDEKTLRPFFIRNFSPEQIILADEYQDVLRLKFQEEEELHDLAERVDVIKRTQSVSDQLLGVRGRTESRFMSLSAQNMATNRAMSSNDNTVNGFGYSPSNRAKQEAAAKAKANRPYTAVLEEDEGVEDDESVRMSTIPDANTGVQARNTAFSIQKDDIEDDE
jgi:NhaP-type Na+/H+ or K+/H+ antiporter